MNIGTVLSKLGFLGEDGNVSLTNCIVYIFVLITAFKILFSGMIIDWRIIHWRVESVDVSATLPLLFSLMNYGHKRMETNKALALETQKESNEVS